MEHPILALIARRHCKRAFLDRPVPREVLAAVLAAAAHAPSSRNTQPWSVAVLTGAARDALSARLSAAHDAGVPARPDFQNGPEALDETAARRARSSGEAIYALKGIDRADAAARRAHVRENFLFFGAPVEMIFHLGADAVPGGFLALGCFLQNVMVGLVAHGLGSCPQYSVAGYPDLVRDELGFGRDRLIVCGLAVGWVDEAAAINRFVPERAPLAEYVQWME
jgi:nitroreductase